MPYVPYAWQEQGKTLAIPRQPRRRLHVLGLMNTRKVLAAYCIEGPVTSEVVVRCIDAFCHTIEMPTVIVMDHASIHTSQAIQERFSLWEKQGVWLFYLPAYAPALNLIEILWRFMKYEWTEFWAQASLDYPGPLKISPACEAEAVFEGYAKGTVRVCPLQLLPLFLRFVCSTPIWHVLKTVVFTGWKKEP